MQLKEPVVHASNGSWGKLCNRWAEGSRKSPVVTTFNPQRVTCKRCLATIKKHGGRI